jgi:hypothetical protein
VTRLQVLYSFVRVADHVPQLRRPQHVPHSQIAPQSRRDAVQQHRDSALQVFDRHLNEKATKKYCFDFVETNRCCDR